MGIGSRPEDADVNDVRRESRKLALAGMVLTRRGRRPWNDEASEGVSFSGTEEGRDPIKTEDNTGTGVGNTVAEDALAAVQRRARGPEAGTPAIWTPFAGAWNGDTTNGTVGNGAFRARVMVVEGMVLFGVYLKLGATSLLPTVGWRFPLPYRLGGDIDVVGAGWAFDSSATARHHANVWLQKANPGYAVLVDQGGNTVYSNAAALGSAGGPFAWNVNDELAFTVSYPIEA